ncbi:MAG: YciI family protein [Nitrososphaerales archaeon]
MPEFIVISHAKAKPEQIAIHRESHARYIDSLRQRGILGLAGKFKDGKGGVYFLLLDSEADALRIASEDPYHSSGVREFVLKEWEKKG